MFLFFVFLDPLTIALTGSLLGSLSFFFDVALTVVKGLFAAALPPSRWLSHAALSLSFISGKILISFSLLT